MTRPFLIVLAMAAGIASLVSGAAFGKAESDDRGGVLYLTIAPELKYDPYTRYCGMSATPLPSQAITEGEVGAAPQVAFVVASWPDSARPELGALAFGIRYPRGIEILRWGSCHGALTAATNTFPLSGEGVAIAMAGGAIDTSRTVEIAWFVIVARSPGRVELVPHPNPLFASHFATSSNGREAPIASLGSLGFGMPGSTPVPEWPGPSMGAACVMDTLCVRLTQKEADYYGSNVAWFGDNVICTPELCGRDAPTGACCLADGTCKIMTWKACVQQKGTYQGKGTACVPDPCQPGGKGSGGPGSK